MALMDIELLKAWKCHRDNEDDDEYRDMITDPPPDMINAWLHEDGR
jgi:hypothetical protein